MSYNKTNWQTGDTITAEKLNNMEQGIEDNSNIFYIAEIYDETSETYSYVSNVVFDDEVEYSNRFFISENGVKTPLNIDIGNFMFGILFINPSSDPSIGFTTFNRTNDDTGLIYTKQNFDAELTFTEDD